MRKHILLLVLIFTLVAVLGASTSVRAAPDVKISEIRIDQPSTDNDEYFELAGTAGASLDGHTYLVIGDGIGGSGVIEAVINLSGNTIPSSGFFVAAESTFTLGTADLTTDLNFENSDNVTHLLVSDFTGSEGDDLDTNDDGVLDVTPWSELVDLIALVEEANPPSNTEYHYGPPSVGPDGSFVPGHVFLCEDGWRIGPFTPSGDDTPGAENTCADDEIEIGNCGDPATFIHEIQGTGTTSPLVGESVIVEGVVVGDFQNNTEPDNGDLNGFHIQEEDSNADGDPTTSEGIFVFAPGAADVSVGNLVRVLGDVAEFSTSGGASLMTELTNVSDLLICAAGVTLPAPTPISLPVSDISDFERYEGMLVTFPQELVIAEYFNFDRFNEIVLALPLGTQDRPHQPTAIAEPGPAATAIAEANALSRITLDDGRSSQNPDPAIHPNGEEFTLTNRFRGGDTIESATGVIDDSFGLYRIQPTEGAKYKSKNPRPGTPDVDGRLKVASFNVLNYFLTLDNGPDICGPARNQECRGADTPEEFNRQRAKIIAALAAINADIFGLIEMENTTGVEPLEDIVDGLNDELGAGTYAYLDTGTIGTDAIKVGIIYKPGTVTPVGDYAILDFSVDERFDDDRNRPVLAQTFMENASGSILTVAVNHLKSKGSACGAGDDDPQQGNCNGTRTEAAKALVDWLATDPTGSNDPDFLITGDLNAYDLEDPIDAVRAGADDTLGTDDDYIDLILEYDDEEAYSFVFDGQLGYLDHALAVESLVQQVAGVLVWHINSDEPDILDYDTSFKQDAQDALYEPNAYRSSDHDPVIVGLDLDG